VRQKEVGDEDVNVVDFSLVKTDPKFLGSVILMETFWIGLRGHTAPL
jgi:hypothetical protein